MQVEVGPQRRPQAPQLVTSSVMSTQAPAHTVGRSSSQAQTPSRLNALSTQLPSGRVGEDGATAASTTVWAMGDAPQDRMPFGGRSYSVATVLGPSTPDGAETALGLGAAPAAPFATLSTVTAGGGPLASAPPLSPEGEPTAVGGAPEGEPTIGGGAPEGEPTVSGGPPPQPPTRMAATTIVRAPDLRRSMMI
jgi:hypothetical protein